MQQGIKFMAWHKLAKKIVVIDALDFALDSYRAHAGVFSGSGHLADIELLQFTGLKDRLGKDIYEGDILRVDWHDSRYPVHTIGPVTWDREEARWTLGEGGSAKHDAGYMEVIGNIWENSNLLTA